jgi:signal transduction histidine kinase
MPFKSKDRMLPGLLPESGMKRPVNDRVDALERLVATLERENARLRGDLLTIARRFSHDLRTPLGGIMSTAEAVREVLSQHDPSALGLADSLLNSAEEMTQLIKQVSFVARASANPLPKTTVHMAEPVFAALQRLESRMIKRGATVKEPSSWPVIPGVLAWLEVIWWHFLLNALKHGGENCRIELGWMAQDGSLRFWINDTGPGVPEGFRGKLFSEFHTLHEKQDVSGLGLSIVQRLVELQGGNCGHETPGQGGALFFFTLPVEGGN